MQTIEEIMKITGVEKRNADKMYETCIKHIGEHYGCNEVIDINYTDCHERDVILKCTLCGKISHKMFVCGRNKWSELSHSCECQRTKKNPKNEKGNRINNDDESFMGKIYGDFEVVSFERRSHSNKSGGTIFWNIKCTKCGKSRTVMPSIAKKGIECSCRKDESRSDLWESRIGERFGKLTIVGFETKYFGKYKATYARCMCDCGREHFTQYINLTRGATKSCGCLSDDDTGCQKTKSPLYSTWTGMRYRCNNPNSKPYKDYGGRGIRVCDEWNDEEHGFENFERWAFDNGYVPDSELSLDRIDVNGNYEPSNCRYVNWYTQAVNKRKDKKPREKKYYEIDGISLTKEDWCKWFSISIPAVDYRMKKLGMSFEDAVTTPKIHVGNKYAGIQSRERVAALNKCNSGIEVNLLFAFFRASEYIDVEPQKRIGKYAVDFLVRDTNIVVECDGYDNHKTKEQILHDCQRDRFLSKEGYIVLRFTGSEINADPDKCASEVADIVKTLCPGAYENGKTNAG